MLLLPSTPTILPLLLEYREGAGGGFRITSKKKKTRKKEECGETRGGSWQRYEEQLRVAPSSTLPFAPVLFSRYPLTLALPPRPLLRPFRLCSTPTSHPPGDSSLLLTPSPPPPFSPEEGRIKLSPKKGPFPLKRLYISYALLSCLLSLALSLVRSLLFFFFFLFLSFGFHRSWASPITLSETHFLLLKGLDRRSLWFVRFLLSRDTRNIYVATRVCVCVCE